MSAEINSQTPDFCKIPTTTAAVPSPARIERGRELSGVTNCTLASLLADTASRRSCRNKFVNTSHCVRQKNLTSPCARIAREEGRRKQYFYPPLPSFLTSCCLRTSLQLLSPSFLSLLFPSAILSRDMPQGFPMSAAPGDRHRP